MDIKKKQLSSLQEEVKMSRSFSLLAEQNTISDNRREREQLLQSLSAQFREPIKPKKDSAFTLVANMLTNMQDQKPLKTTKQIGA